MRDAVATGFLRLAVTAALAAVLAGCSSLGSDAKWSLSPGAGVTTGALADDSSTPIVVALPAIVGAPQNFSEPFLRRLNDSATTHNVALVVDPTLPATYTLRGYIISDRDRQGLKLSYVWDVFDAGGNRINRITGEARAVGQAGSAGDIWSAIPAEIQAGIAEDTISKLVAGLSPAAEKAAEKGDTKPAKSL